MGAIAPPYFARTGTGRSRLLIAAPQAGAGAWEDCFDGGRRLWIDSQVHDQVSESRVEISKDPKAPAAASLVAPAASALRFLLSWPRCGNKIIK